MKKIYVIGDSISIHYGPFLEQYLKNIILYSRKDGEHEALLKLDNPQGANGGDSSMVLSFLNAISTRGGIDTDILLLNCGLHDIKKSPDTEQMQVPIEQYRINLKKIIDVVNAMNLDLVWIRTTPCDENIHNKNRIAFYRFLADCDAYNNAADKIMYAKNIPIIDLFTFTKKLGKDIYCDHVHFYEHVRMKQAAFIAGWLTSYTSL